MIRLATNMGGVLAVLSGYAVLQLVVGLSFSGTYDAGDSVQHYLVAHHAFEHPELFLDHWAKPVFTLLSAPFAYFGFAGIKVLNCLLALGTAWLVYKVAIRLGFRLHLLAPLFLVAAPEYFLAQFSGLTEPMFGFVLLLGIYLFLRGNWWIAALWLSFLPFVRTEGFLLLPVFAGYLLWHGEVRIWPALAVGTVLVSLVGLVEYDTLWWVFTENPYDQGLENYGQGDWLHFPKSYIFVVGVPLLGLTALGWMPWGAFLGNGIPRMLTWERILLIFLPFAVYFGAHMLFWATGIGHSMGMLRVLIAIQPLAALIALSGLSGLVRVFPERMHLARWSLVGLVAAFVAVFPLFSSPAAIHRKDLELTIDQQCIADLKNWYLEQGFSGKLHYYDHPSIAWMLGLDPFDPAESRHLSVLAKEMPVPGSILIWDSWFARKESGMEKKFFAEEYYELLNCVERVDGRQRFEFCVYKAR